MVRRLALATACSALIAVLLLAFALWLAVRPAPGDWTMHVPVTGRLGIDISVPRALQLATDPAVSRWLHRRTVATRAGELRFTWQRPSGTLVVRCAPCTLRVPGLGAEPIVLPTATLSLHRDADRRLSGQLASGGVVLPWQAQLTRQGIELRGDLAPTPIAEIAALFATQVPELRHARIEGDVSARWRIDWPTGRWTVRPHLEAFDVDGLGTATMGGARLPARCAVPPGTRAPSPWLARAVVAAEDQRFFEHPGYDLAAATLAFASNQAATADPALPVRWWALQAAPRASARPLGRHERSTGASVSGLGPLGGGAEGASGGAHVTGGSTLTQQLAKIAITGDERSAARKLRELLYAVEMERTLGKARILELYLALAPWGDGVCGAEQAAQRHFGKPAHALDPIEAAWLASLLRNPAAPADADRVAAVLRGMARGERQRESWTKALDRLSPAQASVRDAASP